MLTRSGRTENSNDLCLMIAERPGDQVQEKALNKKEYVGKM